MGVALVTPSFYCGFIMEIKEVIKLFLEELKERLESFTIEEQEDTHVIIHSGEDDEYTFCIISEMLQDFSCEYQLQIEMTPCHEGDPRAFQLEFNELE